MHKELNERRYFLPDFFASLKASKVVIHIEEGFGHKLGLTETDYLAANPNIEFCSKEEAYAQDIVVILRSPEMTELKLLKRGAILLSMLHYPTRASRVKTLKKRGIRAVSLDSLRDDFMQRIVYNPKGTSENGMETSFKELARIRKDFFSRRRLPIVVSIMGMGMIGLRAARSAGKFGSGELYDQVKAKKAKGVLVQMLPRTITADKKQLEEILATTDILVDATTRDNPYRCIVNNLQLGKMKEDAIILDLTADPYLVDDEGVQVKAIEGIPTGNLNNYIFYKDDPAYENIPQGVRKKHRRTVVSCNAWPGVKPEECMRLYGLQILPVLQKLLGKDLDDMELEGQNYFERAIVRATIRYFEKYEKKA
jgi:alanine dehydrogenase